MKLLHLILSLGLLSSLVPSGGEASEYWRYETDDGVASFVDDAKKIPEKYRERAVRQEAQGLDSYTRATRAPAAALAAAAARPAPEPRVAGRPRLQRSKEYRWIEGAFGAPGEVYALVEVVRDADGEILSVQLHDPDTVRVVSGD